MAKKDSSSKKMISLHYNNEIVKISSDDQIIFFIEYSNGKSDRITFELNTDMDIQWKYISGESSERIKEIGILIEKELMNGQSAQ